MVRTNRRSYVPAACADPGRRCPPVFLVLGLLVPGACSLAIDVDGLQCDSSEDCVVARLGLACVNQVCVQADPASCAVGESCDEPLVAEESEPEPPAGCLLDTQCSDALAPRCLAGTCVSAADGEQWLCPGPPVPAATGGLVDYSFRVYEFVSRRPPDTLNVKACRTNDIECSAAVATFSATTPDGHVSLQLPVGFVGYFQLDASGALSQRFHLTRPVRESQVHRDVQLISPATLSLLSGVAGKSAKASRGLVIIEAVDCRGQPAGGVHFEENTGDAQPFYIVNLLPTISVTSSVRDEANNIASAGFFNAKPGLMTITASLGEEGPVVGVFNAQVRANAVTLIELRPEEP
jgi:hypothetical protein